MADAPLSSLEQTNLNRARNNIDAWLPEIAALTDRDLAPPQSQDSWIRKVGMVNALFQGIENKAHPDVRRALVDFKSLVDSVNAKILSARKAAASGAKNYADAGRIAEGIYALYSDTSPLNLPTDPEKIVEWVERSGVQLDFLKKAQVTLADFAANAPDPRPFQSNERYYRVEMPGKLETMMAETGRQLDGRAELMQALIDFVASTDPADENHVMNRLRGENANEKLGEIRAFAREAAALNPLPARLGAKYDMASLARELEKAASDFAAKAEAAVASVRMPEDRYEPELAAVASERLAAKGFGTPRRLVVNYGPNDKESTSTRIEGEWIVTYRLSWQEFQAVSAENENGSWYLFYNDFTRYSKGDPDTAIGEWLFTGRFRGARILEENIG